MNPVVIPGPVDPPHRVLTMREGSVEGWLVVDVLRDGLSFGGFRITPTVDEAEVRGLARAMTWKLASHGLPVGGAKGGLRCDPRHPDLHRYLRAFADQCRELLSSCVVVGKDMGATDEALDLLYEAVGHPQLMIVQSRHPRCPRRIRDFTGYMRHMTGAGAAWAGRAALGGQVSGARVLIQGAGIVGLGAAHRLAEMGASVVGISDAEGAIFAPEGLPVDALARLATSGRTIDRARIDFSHELGGRDDLFDREADLVMLAASSSSVDESLAAKLTAPTIVEASNFGLRPAARTLLAAAGKRVVPDVIASSSSAALVAHQMASGNGLSDGEVWKRIRGAIESSTVAVLDATLPGHPTTRDAYLACYAGGRP